MKNFYILLYDGYVFYFRYFSDELQFFMYEYELLIYKIVFEVMIILKKSLLEEKYNNNK